MSQELLNNSPQTAAFRSKLTVLCDRAAMLTRSRAFFSARGILEVDCPLLSRGASVDPHIDLMNVRCSKQEIRYLFSSPEYAMKRLLAQGIGDIYQLGHAFRDGESGRLHNPEFTMTEWYRMGLPYKEMILETLQYIELFLGGKQTEWISYRDVLLTHAGIDYLTATEKELMACLTDRGIHPYPNLVYEGRDAILNVILATIVEPALRRMELCVLWEFPASQAALSQVVKKGDELVAERFEIFYNGIELANGYHELVDAEEQRRRLNEANKKRVWEGREALPIDEWFLTDLAQGIPDCCGVAVGFDRLMMLRHSVSDISEVIPFGWNEI